MTKQEAIENVNSCIPSIWSREDVLVLLNGIDTSESINKYSLTKRIREVVDNAVGNMNSNDIVDFSSCEFSIRNSNEVDIDSIDVNTEFIVNQVMSEVEDVINEIGE